MNSDRGWLVCDMDQGVLRCEPTRRAWLAWAMRLVGHSRVYGRDSYGRGGAYGYTTGTDDPHDTRCYWFIERPDRARRGGFAGLDRPPGGRVGWGPARQRQPRG
jgi:hypothetical protein